MTRRCFVFAAMLVAGLGTSQMVAQAQAPGATTVILVRHAEKAAAPRNDPPLTAAGEARAKALLEAVRDAGVTAIITTQYVRTRATAAPTAAALGITPEIVAATGSSHVDDVAATILGHEGQTVLVVGHSNTVPDIIHALGAPAPQICDAEYDNLFIVVLAPPSPARLIRAKYGARSPAGACSPMK